jgi:hypothetical protein
MKYADIVADLQRNNAKATGFYTTEQLLDIFNKASVEVPNARQDAVTLTYSGPVDRVLGYTWQAELVCHFCNEHYVVEPPELEAMISELSEVMP